MGEIELDRRRRETQLSEMLKERYMWDRVKLVFVVIYLIWIFALFVSSYIGYQILPPMYDILIPPVTIGTLIFSFFILWRQWVNIKRTKPMLGKAIKTAQKHARRLGRG